MFNTIYNTNYLSGLSSITKNSIDMIFFDTSIIKDFDADMFISLAMPLLRKEGVLITLSQGIDTARIMISGEQFWKYDMVWNNTTPLLLFDEEDNPIRTHVDINVFSDGTIPFHPLHAAQTADINKTLNSFRKELHLDYVEEDEPCKVSYMRSVLNHPFDKSDKRISMHQLPSSLYKELIETYTSQEDVILDAAMDRGSFLAQVVVLKRNYIGFEADSQNYMYANNSIRKAEIKADRLTSTTYFPMFHATSGA